MAISVTKGNDKTTITITGTYPSKDDSGNYIFEEILGDVELGSNTVVLNLKDVSMVSSDETLINHDMVKLFKIRVDFGDGYSELYSRTIKSETSTIYKEASSWNEIEHYINTEDEVKDDFITISLYNTFGDVVKLKVHYILTAASISNIGTEFDLISANTTNDNKVSFVLRHRATDSVISVYSNNNTTRKESGNLIEDAT